MKIFKKTNIFFKKILYYVFDFIYMESLSLTTYRHFVLNHVNIQRISKRFFGIMLGEP